MEPISVVMIDDNPTFLRIATRFLKEHEDVVVVGAINEAEDALTQIESLRPEVVLIDLAMPGLPGLEAIPLLRQAQPEVKIIALTLLDTDGYRRAALDAGADDFIPKSMLNSDLLPAIRELARGTIYVGANGFGGDTGGQATPKGVLIMEDDDYLRRLYGKALQRSGYQVQEAATLEQAREFLQNQRFDVFLCDIRVGEERGTDLLREHQFLLKEKGTQVVMVSGESRYREESEEMGAEFFLTKPIAINALITLMQRIAPQQNS